MLKCIATSPWMTSFFTPRIRKTLSVCFSKNPFVCPLVHLFVNYYLRRIFALRFLFVYICTVWNLFLLSWRFIPPLLFMQMNSTDAKFKNINFKINLSKFRSDVQRRVIFCCLYVVWFVRYLHYMFCLNKRPLIRGKSLIRKLDETDFFKKCNKRLFFNWLHDMTKIP